MLPDGRWQGVGGLLLALIELQHLARQAHLLVLEVEQRLDPHVLEVAVAYGGQDRAHEVDLSPRRVDGGGTI